MRLEAMVISYLDRFIEKAQPKRVNKPFKAIQKTSEYKDFQDSFTTSIKEQAQWVADNISKLADEANIADDFEALTPDQQSRLKLLVKRGMPTTAQLVSEYRTSQYLRFAFEFSVKEQYKRWGLMVKSVDGVNFTVSNPKYIKLLNDQANYLLNDSSLDETTTDQIISTFAQGKLDGMSNDEVASQLSDTFAELSQSRADMIARTESANAMGDANNAAMVENGVQTKIWVAAGGNPDEECQNNEDDGEIPLDQSFSSGDDHEPAHPNCECYVDAGEIDLGSISIWEGE